jgi:nucleoside-diphosphate-sugar epimerase
MTVLVTGAAGLLGGELIELLVQRGTRPRALIRPGECRGGWSDADVDVRVADLRDRGALAAVLIDVECVLHCAARTGPWGPEDEYTSTNVRGLENLVRLAMTAGARRIVHVSSIAVHGNVVRRPADESSPLRPASNPYSRSKAAGERLLERMIEQDGAPVTIVRPGLLYGPRDIASFGRFAAMIEDGRMVRIGSGANRLPLIYVRDAAEGVVQAAEADCALGRTYLLVNDEPVTQSDYLDAIATELGVPPPSRRIPYSLALVLARAAEAGARLVRRQQSPPVTQFGVQTLGGENRFNIGRARQELGFSPHINLTEGVRRGIEWYRSALRPALLTRKD